MVKEKIIRNTEMIQIALFIGDTLLNIAITAFI